jgi:hypothetical protein
MEDRPQPSFWIFIQFLLLVGFSLVPRAVLAGEVVIVDGTEAQRQLVSL